MDSKISFRGPNFGLKIGINHGSVTNEFHLPNLNQLLPIVPSAAFDSYADQHKDKCLPGTRTDIIDQIREWASSPHGKCIFWLNGLAGTGKSTISRTVAEVFSQSKSLGASFFFERGVGDRGNARKLFPTIARQLEISICQLKPFLQEIVHGNPNIAEKALREQFEKLILQPLQSLERSDVYIKTMVIVIDALDECEGDSDIRLILQLLPQLQNIAARRLRVLLTSRPDLPIRLGFSKIASDDHYDLALHDIPMDKIKDDISLFFDYRLAEIRTERFLPTDWPGDRDLRRLVALSAPLFIFAATICRIFEEPDLDPIDSLTEIFSHQNDQSKLGGTYLPVVDRLLNRQHGKQRERLVSGFQQVIGAIVTLESPLSIASLSKLLGIPERLIHLRLSPLRSVIKVPNNEILPIRLFHQSFRDFLLDPATRQKTPFGINETETHFHLTIKCLLKCQNLRKNICGLPSDGTRRAEVDQPIIDRHLPHELQYACRYWTHHLGQCIELNGVLDDALLFLQNHFLHWVEAMSLLGLVSEVVGMLYLLQKSIPGDQSSALVDFLQDAKRFILKNRQIADEAPLQIYCAGLIFAPQRSIIRTRFEAELPTWICQPPRVEEEWSAELQALEGHSDYVNSVAFSPDGCLLASSSGDKTVRLWDTATGALQQTLEGHSDYVNSVAFSPDGCLLASSSGDRTVRLWDMATGALQQTLAGHSSWVHSLAFSPDGCLLASGSNDHTVRLWDTATGALQQILKGHSSSVESVAFSPDGRLLASGSYDFTVRLWDTARGALQQTLEGHLDAVNSVAFSPDGCLLASSSGDKTVRLWDMATGALQQTLAGHSSWVHSLAFSPDGCLLASGSNDHTVRLWDTATGALQQTLEGHSDFVTSVAISPDGRLLASSSWDRTVRLWNTATGALQQILEGHSSYVTSVAFSPDGCLLASSSGDRTVRLWDPATSALQQILDGHSNYVTLVAFSPDGRLLASGSNDHTVRLWDTATGALQQILDGHSNYATTVAFSPDGRLLASGSDDETVRLWETATGALQQILEGHSNYVTLVAFSPDGRLLASGSDDETVRLWDTATGALQQTLASHSSWAHSVAFSPDGRLLASGSNDHTVRLWDTATGALQQILDGHSNYVTTVAFSPDGRLLASSSYDETVLLWDTAMGALQQILEGHSSYVTLVAFSPDGRLLASCSDDETVRLWDTATGALQLILDVNGFIRSLEFALDGSYLTTNLGNLNIPSLHEIHAPRLTHRNPDIFIEQGQWIKLNGNNILWLPPESRFTCSMIVGNVLALGHASGRVSFIGFRV